MKYNSNDITQLLEQFVSRTLPKEKWTHEAHIIVAVGHCWNYPGSLPLNIVRQRITDYNIAVGTENTQHSGYHETVTKFWLILVDKFLKQNQYNTLEEAVNALISSRLSSKSILLSFYSKEILFSTDARWQWIEPGLYSIDFLDKLIGKEVEDHFTLSDELFEEQFRHCTLEPALFSHEAHLRLAYIHLQKYNVEQAIDNICRQIQDYAASLGAQDKYHTTVTVAAIKAVYHFMLKNPSDSFYDFISNNPRLKNNFKDLIAAHYGFNIFASPVARQEFLEPDLLPFD